MSVRWRNAVAAAIATALLSAALPLSAAEAITKTPPFKLVSKPSADTVLVGEAFKLSGTLSPAKRGIEVQRQQLVNGKWKNVSKATAVTNSRGQWAMKLVAPTKPSVLKYRIVTPKFKTTNRVVHKINVIRPPSISIKGSRLGHPAGAATTLSGDYADLGTEVAIVVQQFDFGTWTDATANLTMGKSGWTARVTLPTAAGAYLYRAVATGSAGSVTSEPVSINVLPAQAVAYQRSGPGSPSRIWGLDVSRWNHIADTNKDGVKDILDDGLPIDYTKAYAQGARFVFIKASDGNDLNSKGDDFAKKYFAQDRDAAQAAGLMTGFYHYPGMLETKDLNAFLNDAHDEAVLAASRLAAVGGYNANDLPYVLDFEGDTIPGSGLAPGVSKQWLTLWVKTWLNEMEARTGRKPIIYSGPGVAGRLLVDDGTWSQYKFWTAHPTCRFAPATEGVPCTADLLNQGALPGFAPADYSASGFYDNPWISNGVFNWTFWQYGQTTGAYFGVQNGSKIDVNVFGGSDADFAGLVNSVWTPLADDYQPTAAAALLDVQVVSAAGTGPATLNVTATRASNGAAAVSGELAITQLGLPIVGAVVRATGIGTWTITLPVQASGFIWSELSINFTDKRGFYAPVGLPWSLQIS